MSPLLRTTTAEGALKGMILGRAPHELGDQEAAYLQDILVSQPGFLPRRGAITGTTALGNNLATRRPAGITSCVDPAGNLRILVLYTKSNAGTSTSFDLCGAVYDSSLTFLGNIILAAPSSAGLSGTYVNFNTTPGLLITTCPAIDGGVLISYGAGYGPGHLRWVVRWWGGYSPANAVFSDTVAFGTLGASASFTSGSTAFTLTVAELAKITPGCFFQNVGVVKTVNYAGGTGTLQEPSIQTVTGANVNPASAVNPIRTRGSITTTAGGTLVTGFGTRFRENEGQNAALTLRTFILTDPDNTPIASSIGGAGNDVPSDTQLVGSAGAGPFAMLGRSLTPYKFWTNANTPYKRPATNGLTASLQKGSIVFTFAGYQFYANDIDTTLTGQISSLGAKAVSRVWIGGPTWHNEMDHSPDDGNFFDIPPSRESDPAIYAGIGGSSAAVVCRARESFAIHGNSPDNFRVDKIASDGCLGPQAITQWQGNSIWLGRDGIWMYDGSNDPINLVADSLGLEWTKRIAAYQTESTAADAGTYPLNQAYCFVYRDHLFVNVTNTGSQHSVYTDGVARTLNPMQLMIYLPNNALTFLTNFNFVGYLPGWPPVSQQEGYVVLAQDSATAHFLYPMSNFFKQGVATTDTIITANCAIAGPASVGPWFHLESRKFDASSGLGKKAWKQLAIEYNMTNLKQIFMETVNGLNTTGVRATLPFIGSGAFQAKKIKFRARDQYMSFRLYEDVANRPATLILGAWQWAYKYDRAGAI